MLCDKCKTKEATFHYKVTTGGKTTETRLCADCAKELGISSESIFGSKKMSLLNDFVSDEEVFGNLFNGLLGKSMGTAYEGAKQASRLVCPSCGMSESELSRNGKLGCSQCYKTFATMLSPTILKIHGNVEHTGKSPAGFAEKKTKLDEIKSLKRKLETAIEAQEYEEAARLRDAIKALEAQKQEGGEDK